MLEFINSGDKVNINSFIFENYDILENDEIFKRIYGKTYQENNDISLSDLTYIKLLHYNYNNEIVVGELIINKVILDEVKKVFETLFNNKYQIYSMKLIDDFFIKDDPIMTDRNNVLHNNTYSFYYRKISNKDVLSNHALGIAIDINPFENPYTPRNKDGSFDDSLLTEKEKELLINREEKAKTNRHIITLNDIICNTFSKEGFECGGIWPIQSDLWSCDWQHFEPNDSKILEIKEKMEENKLKSIKINH